MFVSACSIGHFPTDALFLCMRQKKRKKYRMINKNFNAIGKKINQTSALSVYPRFGISLSASETDDRFYLYVRDIRIEVTRSGRLALAS